MNKISLAGRKVLLFLLNIFMLLVRPLLGPRGACRFTPTCSQYAKEAITKYGVATLFTRAVTTPCLKRPFSRAVKAR